MKLQNASLADREGKPERTGDNLGAEFLELTHRDRQILDFLGMGCLDGVWYWDLENPERSWLSKRFWDLLGYDPDQRLATASSWFDVLHPDDHAGVHHNFEKLAADPDQPMDMVLRYNHANGSIKWMRSRGTALRNDEGKVARILGVHIDITELKQAQHDLQAKSLALKGAAAEMSRRERELQFIFDQLPVHIWYKDEKHRLLRVNEPAASSIGMTVADLESGLAADRWPGGAPELAEIDTEIMNAMQPHTDTVERADPATGKRRWIKSDRIPYFEKTLGRRTLLIVESDVTDLKTQERVLSRLNAELDRQRQLYVNLYRRTPVMMYSISDEGLIQDVSDLWLTKFGYSREEVIGRKSMEFLDQDSQRQARQVVQPKFWRDGFITDVPFQVVHKDGRHIEVELCSIVGRNPITGRSNGLTVMVDVSERNAAFKEASIQSAELETLHERMEQFVRAASHDLQEPIRKIQVFTDMLIQGLGGRLEGDERYFLDTVVNSAHRMGRLIKDLLAYSLVRNCKMVIQPLDLDMVIAAVADTVREQCIGLPVQIVAAPALTVRADEAMTMTLFKTLFDNAVHFRDAERPLLIEVDFQPDPSGGAQICFVRDNGIGFDPDYSWKIFEPFVRLHDRDVATGSGIGLAVCKTICERHGWSIWTEDTSEDGSSFAIRIPNQQIDGEGSA